MSPCPFGTSGGAARSSFSRQRQPRAEAPLTERLAETLDCLVSVDRRFAIARCENDRQLGTVASNSCDKLAAGHARHCLISNDQVDVGMRRDQLKRLVARGGFDHFVAKVFEQRGGVHQDDRIVVDDEDAPASRWVWRGGLVFPGRDRRRIDADG